MPDTYQVERRVITGKAVRKLRQEGTIPGNIYGRHLESVAVQLSWANAREMLNDHGRNTLIELQVSDEQNSRPVVVRDIGRDAVSGELHHIDFFQVDLTRTIQASVPINFIGEAPAFQTYGGVFVRSLDVVRLEALPNEMPEAVDVLIDGLEELDQSLTIADIAIATGVTILNAEDQSIAQIARPRLEVEETEEVPEGEEGLLPEGEESEDGTGAAESNEEDGE